MLCILLNEYQVNAQDLKWLEICILWDTCFLAFDIFSLHYCALNNEKLPLCNIIIILTSRTFPCKSNDHTYSLIWILLNTVIWMIFFRGKMNECIIIVVLFTCMHLDTCWCWCIYPSHFLWSFTEYFFFSLHSYFDCCCF